MSNGMFFPRSSLALIKPPPSTVPLCGLCGLWKECQSPKMVLSGTGKLGVLIVGEAPGREEDREGRQFVGKTGKLLQECLRSFGVEMRRDCWITNALICFPKSDKIKNKKMIDFCRPNVLKEIQRLQPTVIILLGGTAIKSVLGHVWKEDPGGAKRWAGYTIPCRKPNAWLCPTFHPSYIAREKRDGALYKRTFTDHLKAAFELAPERPWKEIPDYKKGVEIILDGDQAADAIRELCDLPVAAYDYETSMLKPEKGEIVCASIGDDKQVIAFPMMGKAIPAMKEFLQSNVRKIASNLAFEDKWSRVRLGTGVRNWFWDTMLAAHALDSRRGISGLKFQAFTLLGQEDYDSHLRPMLESDDNSGYGRNKVRDIAIRDLLTYCALDSRLEYLVAKRQAAQLGVKWP